MYLHEYEIWIVQIMQNILLHCIVTYQCVFHFIKAAVEGMENAC